MSYNPQNPNGQTTSANSSPVVIASDQSAFPITANAGTNLNTSLLALESGGNLAALAGTVSSGKINVNFASGSLPSGSNTIGNVEITDGTNTANVLSPGNTPVGQNAQFVAGSGYTTGTLTLSSGTNNTNWYDMLNYAWVSVEILTNASSTNINFQTSGDASQTNVVAAVLTSSGAGLTSGSAGLQNTSSATGTYHGPRQGRYFRINSALTGGNTTTLVITFYTQPSGFPVVAAEIGGAGSTGSTAPSSALYMGMVNSSGNLSGAASIGQFGDGATGNVSLSTGQIIYNGSSYDHIRSASAASGTTGTGLLGAGAMGIYNSSAPTASNGDYYQLQLDSSANLKVNVAAGGFNFTPSTSGGVSVATSTALTNSAVAVKAFAGQVYGWYIYNPNSAVTYVQFYNSTTGSTVVGTSVLNPIGIPPGGASNIVAAFGIAFSTAISIAACTTAGGNTAPATSLVANIYYD